MAEILSRAEQEQQRLLQEQVDKLNAERKDAEEEKKALLEKTTREKDAELEQARLREREAVEKAVADAKAEIFAQIDEERRQKAHLHAHYVVRVFKSLVLVLLVGISAFTFVVQNSHTSLYMWILTGTLLVVNFLAYADLLKFRFMDPFFDGVHRRLTKLFGG